MRVRLPPNPTTDSKTKLINMLTDTLFEVLFRTNENPPLLIVITLGIGTHGGTARLIVEAKV